MYLYKTDNFFHINHYLKSVSKAALLHRFYCNKALIIITELDKTFSLFKENKNNITYMLSANLANSIKAKGLSKGYKFRGLSFMNKAVNRSTVD